MDAKVHDNTDRHRFEVIVDGKLGGFADYRTRNGLVTITHSQVDPTYRGQGVGGQLAKQTLDMLRERGVKVVPVCPFFAEYVAQHPEYDDIVANR
jgi:predicted GNAT family acetyltransferase